MRKYRKRAHFSEAEKMMMWDRWQQGDSLHTIARLLDTSHTSVRRNLVLTRGYPAGPTNAFQPGPELGGAGGNLARHCGRTHDSIDCCCVAASAVDGQP